MHRARLIESVTILINMMISLLESIVNILYRLDIIPYNGGKYKINLGALQN